jgi:hypothetical protein
VKKEEQSAKTSQENTGDKGDEFGQTNQDLVVSRPSGDKHCGWMIKTILLIFDPANTWDKIEAAHRRIVTIFFLFLLPLIGVSAAAGGFSLIKWGREQGPMDQMKAVPQNLVIRYEATQIILSLLMVFGGALALKQIGEGFHRRHKYSECFTTLAYSMGPLFLFRMLEGLPVLNTWVCWGIGITFSAASLYRGLPRIMKPDPSNALGLYLLSSLLLIMITGIAQYLAILVLDEKVLAKGLPF